MRVSSFEFSDLAKAGYVGQDGVEVELDEAGAIAVDEFSQTTLACVYAVGDVTNRMNLTPVAIAEGAALARTLFGGEPTRVDYRDVPSAVFGQPQIGTVGLSEENARREYDQIDVYRRQFRPLRQALGDSPEKTMMKLVVDRRTDRVVGAHMVGPDAGEIIQGVAIALKCGATKAHFDATIGIHPTSAEEFVTMRKQTPPPA